MHMHCSAIVDDMLIITNNVEEVKKAIGILYQFSNATGILVNPKKSAYAWLHCKHTYTPCIDNTPFELFSCSGTYRYLGIHISLNLCWEVQKAILETSLHFILHTITKKYYITGALLVRLINATFMAMIRYRMQVIVFDYLWLNKISGIITQYLNNASRTYGLSYGAWVNTSNLINLHILQVESGANSMN